MSRQVSLLEPDQSARATDAAQRTQAWERQRESARRCRECPLFANATQTVWGEGPILSLIHI